MCCRRRLRPCRQRAGEKRRSCRGTTFTLLYIEDNLSNLKPRSNTFWRDHTEIRLTDGGMQGEPMGLEMARRHRPDLILLDLHLPDVPGWEVLIADLRGRRGDPRSIPVVVVSADATPRTDRAS